MSRAREVGDLGSVVTVDAGNVGIGTSSPASKLQLSEAGGSTLTFERTDSTDGNGVIKSIGNTGVENTRITFGGGVNNALIFGTGSSATERMRIQSDGSVGIGTSSPGQRVDVASSGDTYTRVRSTTSAFTGVDFGQTSSGVGIIDVRDNQPLIFYTNDTERLRILSSGGITFNGDTAAANALDDYEQGTWTPTLDTGTAIEQTGAYIKIGSFVWLKGRVNYTITDTSSNYLRLGGLPFVIPSDPDNRGYQIMYAGTSGTHAWETFDGTGALALSQNGITFNGNRSVFSGVAFQFNYFYPTEVL
jgi:hypothetical protein